MEIDKKCRMFLDITKASAFEYAKVLASLEETENIPDFYWEYVRDAFNLYRTKVRADKVCEEKIKDEIYTVRRAYEALHNAQNWTGVFAGLKEIVTPDKSYGNSPNVHIVQDYFEEIILMIIREMGGKEALKDNIRELIKTLNTPTPEMPAISQYR